MLVTYSVTDSDFTDQTLVRQDTDDDDDHDGHEDILEKVFDGGEDTFEEVLDDGEDILYSFMIMKT